MTVGFRILYHYVTQASLKPHESCVFVTLCNNTHTKQDSPHCLRYIVLMRSI